MMVNCNQLKNGLIATLTSPYHYYGIRIIQKLQCKLRPLIPFFEFISIITRPFIAYYYIFPLTFFMAPHLGLSVLWTAVISDAINLLLKGLLHGDRPYWWAPENADKYQHLTVKQYQTTCEVSPGTPSGHAFITTAIWTTLLLMWCNCEPRTCAKLSTKILSMLALLLICLSRVVIAAHFPHQVILGVGLGILVAYLMTDCEFYKNPPISYFRWAVILLVMGLVAKVLFPSMDLCSCWSILKAQKYCNNLAWVQQGATKPFLSYLKLASILTGTGLSMLIITALKTGKVRLKNAIHLRIISAIASLIVTSFIFFVLNKYHAEGPPGLSYVILKNMMIPLTVIVFVPLLIGTYEN